jgi:hypothetical protein
MQVTVAVQALFIIPLAMKIRFVHESLFVKEEFKWYTLCVCASALLSRSVCSCAVIRLAALASTYCAVYVVWYVHCNLRRVFPAAELLCAT